MQYPAERTYYRKLIRDNVPNMMTAKGVTFSVQPIEDDQLFTVALGNKLLEEAQEFVAAVDHDERVSELVDVLDVIDELKARYAITDDDLAAVRTTQRERKGGFDQRLLLLWSEQNS